MIICLIFLVVMATFIMKIIAGLPPSKPAVDSTHAVEISGRKARGEYAD